MIDTADRKKEISEQGYTIINDVFKPEEISFLIAAIEESDQSNPTFRKNADVFAIRQFLKEVPVVIAAIFNKKLLKLIEDCFGKDYFVVKSIYFDKPESSNWFVAWHQDLTISVDKKSEISGYLNWTTKHQQFAVQPPLEMLEDNFTLRIHLDNTDRENGALKVVPGSHARGIYRPENIDWDKEQIAFCPVKNGGVMVMRPLLMHASDKTVNNARRRVIHIEFSRTILPNTIHWSETIDFSKIYSLQN